MASQQEKFSLLITGDVDYRYRLMSGIVNGFPQLEEPWLPNYQPNTQRYVEVDGRDVLLDLYVFVESPWESPSSYYRQANGIIILYDVTDEESLDDVFSHWLRPIEQFLCLFEDEDLPIVLVGGNIEKRDKQVVSIERMRMKAGEIGHLKLRYAEVSTASGENVETVLQTITRDMINRFATKLESQQTDSTKKVKHCVVF